MASTYSNMAMEAVKLVVIGDKRAGKTCLLRSFVLGSFPDDYVGTVFGALVDRQRRVCPVHLFALQPLANNIY